MEIFYYPDIISGALDLPEEESRHIARVLRKKEGDIISITDGKGRLYKAEITSIGKVCHVSILSETIQPITRNYRFHLAMAPTKMIDRIEWAIEKCVELGIDEISPIICEHSERKVLKTERLTAIAVAAMKQSGNINLPTVNDPQSFEQFISRQHEGNLCIAHCHDLSTPYYSKEVKKGNNIILIGPEGDFSLQEVRDAQEAGFREVSLGDSILRVETAAVYACCCCKAAFENLSNNS
ncbi:MAG: 16S rRNA (uracil(1498)-N(3))-methyltransferase [Bacteroidales bacterium]|nr:16S rRNA (uracil(1498)-N(3))-methyltransferase [Bacteroidales bacterium]